MLNNEKTGLQVFDQFSIDESLPKFKGLQKGSSGTMSFTVMSGGNVSGFDPQPTRLNWASQDLGVVSFNGKQKKNSVLKCFLKLFEKKQPEISVQQFFSNVMFELKDIETYKSKIENYFTAIDHALKMGQVALVEELKDMVDLIKKESLLLDSNYKTVITEEQLVKFVKECEKGLALTYTKNFVRIIPNAVLEQKSEADKLNVFDNYVILHYDIGAKAEKMTKKEIEKKKDPILFGVIKDVRKLYYIADWKDEFCDLTLQAFIDKFGKKAITANDITVKFKKP